MHSFHLPCGEMTITLQDAAMLLGLPIHGNLVVGLAVPDGWRARVEQFLGTALPEDKPSRSRCISGVHLLWLRSAFAVYPGEVDEATVTFHCRAWELHMFGSVLFPDATGDCALWMYIHCLQDWDEARGYSWGSTVLGFLYGQLCESCRRRAQSSSL
jgi:hypothetical protein